MTVRDPCNRCYFGDCREQMRVMIDEGIQVQTVVTSPPYWALRDYGVAGQLGLEKTPEEYIDHMVGVFRLVRDLLAKNGTLWLNMGDSYIGSRAGGKSAGPGLRGGRQNQNESKAAKASWRRDKAAVSGESHKKGGADFKLKYKDLCMMPARLAIALQADGWYLRSVIIWHKPNCMPESAKDRPTTTHEYLYLLSKSERYYYDYEAIQEIASEDTHARYARGRSNNHKYADGGPGNQTLAKTFAGMAKPVAGWANGAKDHSAIAHAQPDATRTRKLYPGNGVGFGHGFDGDTRRRGRVKNNASFDEAMRDIVVNRNKRTVWTIPTEPFSDAHFATFPSALVEPCILAGTKVGDIVFDPFLGSGTVGQVAASLGRRWLGCELNKNYGMMQVHRTAQMGMAL